MYLKFWHHLNRRMGGGVNLHLCTKKEEELGWCGDGGGGESSPTAPTHGSAQSTVAQAFTASASKLEAELIRQNTSNGFCNFGTAMSFICVKKGSNGGVAIPNRPSS
jgi:hypothetical protein